MDLFSKKKILVTFKNFKAFVEKKSGYAIKVLRYDRGDEFTSRNLMNIVEQIRFATI